MAIINKPQDKDEQQQQQPTTGGQSAFIGGTSAPQAKGSSSGRFTNIQSYLNANKGENLAGKIGQNIQEKAQQTEQGINQAGQSFNQQAQSRAEQFRAPENYVQNALSNPDEFAKNEANVQKFSALRDAAYTGPKNIADLSTQGKLANQLQTVQNQAKQTQTEGGRFNLLRQMFGKPTYSGGQQKLDQLLLQTNPGQTKQLGQTLRTARDVSQDYQKATGTSEQLAQNLAKEAQQTREQTQGALGAKATQEQTGLDQRVQDVTAQRQAAQQEASQRLAQGKFTQDLLQQAGLKDGETLYDVDLSKYMSPSQIEATKENVAQSQDYARLQALQKLSGNTLTPEQSAFFQSFGGQYNPDQDITKQAAYTLNPDQIKQAVSERGAELKNLESPYASDIETANQTLYAPGQGVGGKSLEEHVFGNEAKQNVLSNIQNAFTGQQSAGLQSDQQKALAAQATKDASTMGNEEFIRKYGSTGFGGEPNVYMQKLDAARAALQQGQGALEKFRQEHGYNKTAAVGDLGSRQLGVGQAVDNPTLANAIGLGKLGQGPAR